MCYIRVGKYRSGVRIGVDDGRLWQRLRLRLRDWGERRRLGWENRRLQLCLGHVNVTQVGNEGEKLWVSDALLGLHEGEEVLNDLFTFGKECQGRFEVHEKGIVAHQLAHFQQYGGLFC